jgi:hypothetical protein
MCSSREIQGYPKHELDILGFLPFYANLVISQNQKVQKLELPDPNFSNDHP